MNDITLTLTPQEAVDVINIIGQLPTQANVHPLYTKLRAQAEAQLPKPETKDE